MDAEVILIFQPDDKKSNVKAWLHKIEQLGDVYGWDNKDGQFIMQLRLRGSARDWYYVDLDNYSLSWAEWKDTLQTAFPRSTDFVDLLETMLARVKTDAESMTKYFHDKISLLKKCQIEGVHSLITHEIGVDNPPEGHPNIKLFITQAGLQSTDEAITAGVPLVAIPMLGDQWYNAEKYVKYGIGIKLDIETLNTENFKHAVETVINDNSYRQNIVKLREMMSDQPEPPLQRTMWWIEYVVRNKGAKQLKAPNSKHLIL